MKVRGRCKKEGSRSAEKEELVAKVNYKHDRADDRCNMSLEEYDKGTCNHLGHRH